MHRTPWIVLALTLWLNASLLCAPARAAKPKPTGKPAPLRFVPIPTPAFRLPRTNNGCYRMVRQQTRLRPTWHRRYPATVEEAQQWLQEAIRSKQILWNQARIVARLQTSVDNHSHGRMFLLFGNNHSIVEHYRFFNELWHQGQDGLRLEGVTHLALEAFVTGLRAKPTTSQGRRKLRKLWRQRLRQTSARARVQWRRRMVRLLTTDQQPLIDLYVVHGDRWALQMLEVINHFLLGSQYPPELLKELHQTLRYARRYRRRSPIQVVASDMSLHLRRQARRLLCWVYPLREMFSLHVVTRYLKRKRSVIAYMWGADHIRKDHLPRFLSPTDKVLAVRLAGGSVPDIWDMALARLKIPPRLFAIPTPGAREGDFLIHLPPRASLLAQALKQRAQSRARLSRKPSRSAIPQSRMLIQSYAARVNRALQRLRYEFNRCAWRNRRTAQVELTIDGKGKVDRVTFPKRQRLLRWQRQCIRKLLWMRSLEAPPYRRPVRVKFRLRFVP